MFSFSPVSLVVNNDIHTVFSGDHHKTAGIRIALHKNCECGSAGISENESLRIVRAFDLEIVIDYAKIVERRNPVAATLTRRLVVD